MKGVKRDTGVNVREVVMKDNQRRSYVVMALWTLERGKFHPLV